jgi:DNA-binding FadR family transcriptional regulator
MSRDKFHHRVVQELGHQIGSGVYAPGEPIPIETALALQFGVSRVVVREAVKILVAKGLIEVRTRTGTRVRPHHMWNLLDAEVIAWRSAPMARTGRLDLKVIADLIELRRVVEPAAARLAAERADSSDLATMRAAFEQLSAAALNGGDYVTPDLAFHAAILAAGRNQFLTQLQTALGETLKTSIAISRRDPARAALSLPIHEALLVGIERRDPDAAAAAVEQLIALATNEIARAFGVEPGACPPPGFSAAYRTAT